MLSQINEEKLRIIFRYFADGSDSDGIDAKIKQLCLECGEYRDSIMFDLPEQNKVKEITDVLSCCLQLYLYDRRVREQFEKTLDETIWKINKGYYKK